MSMKMLQRNFRMIMNDVILIVKLSEIDDAMNIVSEKIHKEENETLKMLFEMHRSVANGEMKQIVKKAYSYLEAGKIVEASKILNKQTVDAIYSEYLNAQITNLSRKSGMLFRCISIKFNSENLRSIERYFNTYNYFLL